MDNWEEICEEQREMNYIYDEAYKQLTELIMTVDPIELLSFLSADYYFSLLGKDCMFELAEAEYIAGICISSKHHSSIKIDKNEIDLIHELIKVLVKKQISINYYSSLCDDDSEEETYLKLFSGSLKNDYSFIRGYSWYRTIEENNIKAIFDGYNDTVETILGFYPEDVFKFADAYVKIISSRLKDCASENDFMVTLDELFDIIVTSNLEIMSVDKNELFRECSDLDEHHFEAIINFFGSSVTREECEETIKYFTDDNFFSEHPIIMDGNKVLMINHQLLLWNLRTCVDEELKKDNKIWNEYDKKHKAKFLEAKSVEIIRSLLPQCDIYSSLYYKPAGEQTACELDAIAVYDKVVIIIEAKSGIYSKPARRGGIKRLETVVKKNIEYAYCQGERTRNYILDNKDATFYCDSQLKRKALRLQRDDIVDVFIINTTIDYYAELGVDLYKLKRIGVYKSDEFPWTVCISDLEVIRDFIDFPNQFLYYMYLRRAVNNNFSEENGAFLLYELDLFAMYKTENTDDFHSYDLFSESDKQQLNGLLATSCDFSEYYKEYYDACFEGKDKMCITPKKYNTRFLEMVRQLEEYNSKGVAVFVLRMLDLDLDDQNELMERIDMICQKSLDDKKTHVLTIKRMPQHFFETPFGMVVYSGFEKDRKNIENRAKIAGAIQQGQTGLKDWITLCIYHDDTRHFINQFYFHSGSDKLTEEMRAITNHIPVTAPIKVYPNDLCPCNSGKKYKKCCGKRKKV